ncbi:MAG: hypothetical protein A2074_07235 [Candidatus Aquicultor primus]|uniref:Uncharacterized protein n=1 Tax=Candidatus Aquicultor primus TaxID=1797195 RepID=A0A1F2UQ11_9ACTN|nr:MAG: hypothetical protein A2074_07235 [Candidatus Aquicultor primus]
MLDIHYLVEQMENEMSRYTIYVGIVVIAVSALSMTDKLILRKYLLTGEMILQYSTAKKFLTVMNFPLWAILIYLEYAYANYTPDIATVIIVSAIVIPIAILECYKAFSIIYVVGSDGIKKQSLLGTLEVQWQAIHEIKFKNFPQIRGRAGCFVILSHKKKLILCSNIEELEGLALAIKDNLPPDKWKASELAIKEILAQNIALQEENSRRL